MTDAVDIRTHLTTMLAATWSRANWGAVKRHDRTMMHTFGDRVFDASYKETLDGAITHLCQRLDAGEPCAPKESDQYFKAYKHCKSHEIEVLKMMRGEYRMLAAMVAHHIFGEKEA